MGRLNEIIPARIQMRPLHQVKGRAVGLNGKNAGPAMEPLAPTPGISGAPLPKGGGFLHHGFNEQIFGAE